MFFIIFRGALRNSKVFSPRLDGWIAQASSAAAGDHEAAESAAHLADLRPFDLCLGGGWNARALGRYWVGVVGNFSGWMMTTDFCWLSVV